MSKTVEIDDDIYDFIESNAQGLGQTVSTVLRRFLPLAGPKDPRAAVQSGILNPPRAAATESSLMRIFADPAFRQKNVTDRYLKILSFVHKENPRKFEKVIEVSGRSRKYFGRSREEIEKSGTHTHPRLIPDSGYWAMTNADTIKKREMIRKVLEIMGYSAEDIRAAGAALE